MAIRLKKEVWACIRSEYVAGATAEELAVRYKGVKAASIHARASRDKWRDVAITPNQESSQYAADRAKVDGISIDEAAALEAIDQNRATASHRAEVALLGTLLTDGLNLASEASKQNNPVMAKSASVLISSVKEGATALRLKMSAARIAYGLDPCPPFSELSNKPSEIKPEVL